VIRLTTRPLSLDGDLVGLPYRFTLRRPFSRAFARALETLDALLLESVWRLSTVVGRDAQDPVQVDVVDGSQDDDRLRLPSTPSYWKRPTIWLQSSPITQRRSARHAPQKVDRTVGPR
jgi:hypothetical protein